MSPAVAVLTVRAGIQTKQHSMDEDEENDVSVKSHCCVGDDNSHHQPKLTKNYVFYGSRIRNPKKLVFNLR